MHGLKNEYGLVYFKKYEKIFIKIKVIMTDGFSKLF